MFRHKGKTRTYTHNLRLASLLSFVAGMVNISGVLFINVLTTNVTGHFAFFAEELLLKNYSLALAFLCFILSFLSGAFVAGLLTEYSFRKKLKSTHKYPMLLEISILFIVGIAGNYLLEAGFAKAALACLLLFAMGLQNSLVTQISNSIVRTTHLTGLFTDLGIELAQLFFYNKPEQKYKLKRSIDLRLAIIFFFFAGGVSGGYVYAGFSLVSLLIAAFLLIVALVYDMLRFRFYKQIRRFRK